MLTRSVRDNALGSIIGGIVLALLTAVAGKATGWLPQLWDSGKRGLAVLWRLLGGSFSLTLHGWAWALVWLVVALAVQRIVRDWPKEDPSATQADSSWPTLETLELSIMQALAENDGQPAFLTDLASRSQVSQLRLGKALENLQALGLIAPQHDVLYGPKAALTRRGRDYILAHGLGA